MSECCLFFYQFLCGQSAIHSIGMAFGRFHASPHGNPFYRINISPTFCCVSQEFWKNWVKLAWPFMNSLLAWTPAPASQTLTTQELQPVHGEPQISTLWTDLQLAWPFMNSLLAWTPAPASQTLTTQELQPVHGEPQISTLWTDFIHLHPISGKTHAYSCLYVVFNAYKMKTWQNPADAFGILWGPPRITLEKNWRRSGRSRQF